MQPSVFAMYGFVIEGRAAIHGMKLLLVYAFFTVCGTIVGTK